MGDATTTVPKEHHGIIRFGVPDLSVPAYDRALFAFPSNKKVEEYKVPLHDARSDPALMSGLEGLDAHGFTYIKHRSKLSESGDAETDWYTGNNVEDVYLPEVAKLICDLTGAKRAVVNNVAFRRRLADLQTDKENYVLKRGDKLDHELAKLPKDVTLVYGKDAGASLEPARVAHVDFSLKGLRDTARFCRQDIKAAAQPALDAEDTDPSHAPRYACFSVWRPVRTVKRDPLIVCDMQTVKAEECVPCPYRAISNVNSDGEYMAEVVAILPPKEPEKQKWYWMPEQHDDEVLIIKFADTGESENEGMGGICGMGGAPHCSPIIPDTEEEEARCSIEARVLAFW